MTRVSTWFAMLLLLAATVAVLVGLRQFQVRRHPDAETVRKLFHICGGALGLTLPWLFDDLAPVLILGILVSALFFVIRVYPPLRDGIGQVMLAIHRETIGEFCILASFCLLFWLTGGDKLLYSIPILILTLADALAALIGQTYGKFHLHMKGDRKSMEGAVTFLLIAFFCVHVPVLLWGDTGRIESLLIAVDASAMVMLAEAAAWWGLDNLIIPIWGYMVLKSLLQMDAAQLSTHLVFLISLSGFMYLWRSRTTLGDDALADSVLWGYVVWAVGGWQWALAPLLQLAAYATVTAGTPMDKLRDLGFPVVLANTAGSIPWLLAFRETGDAAFYIPFVACYGANTAIITLVRTVFVDPGRARRRVLSFSAAIGMLVVVPSLVAVYGLRGMTVCGIAASLVALVAATLVFSRVQPGLADYPVDYWRWLRQAIVVGAGSVLALGIEHGQLWVIRLMGVT